MSFSIQDLIKRFTDLIPSETISYNIGPSPTPKPSPTPLPSPTPTAVPSQGYSNIPGYANGSVPAVYAGLINQYAPQFGIHPAVAAAIGHTESGFRSNAVNNQDYGPYQINLPTHPGITPEQAMNPEFAVKKAMEILKSNLDYFGGDINRAIAAYNVGKGGANVKGNNPFGGGPKGQYYLNKVGRNLSPELIKQLGIVLGDVVPLQ